MPSGLPSQKLSDELTVVVEVVDEVGVVVLSVDKVDWVGDIAKQN